MFFCVRPVVHLKADAESKSFGCGGQMAVLHGFSGNMEMISDREGPYVESFLIFGLYYFDLVRNII